MVGVTTPRPAHLVAAPDKFRGTVSAADAAAAIAGAAAAAGWTATTCPLADGGEGTLDALGGANRRNAVSGPLGEPVEAHWRLDGLTAVIEMARVAGLALAGGPERNDPIAASTRGVGQLIALAVDLGAKRVLVTLGGSATTDGGFGAIEGLGSPARLAGVDVVVACDVTTRFCDAAVVFGPQKGASPAQVRLLTGRLERLCQVYRERYGVDVADLAGAGAAGGLAGGLAALGARLVPGFDLVADETGLDDHLEGAALVVTGEGFLDEQSFEGKVVGGVLERAARLAVPVLVVCGDADPEAAAEVVRRGGVVASLLERVGEARALGATGASIAAVVSEELRARSC
jgi:glycerate kinase